MTSGLVIYLVTLIHWSKHACFKTISLKPSKNCLPLRKWSSNEPQLVTRLPKDLQEAAKAYEVSDKTLQIKTLGLTWLPLEDHFVYTSSSEYVSNITN